MIKHNVARVRRSFQKKRVNKALVGTSIGIVWFVHCVCDLYAIHKLASANPVSFNSVFRPGQSICSCFVRASLFGLIISTMGSRFRQVGNKKTKTNPLLSNADGNHGSISRQNCRRSINHNNIENVVVCEACGVDYTTNYWPKHVRALHMPDSFVCIACYRTFTTKKDAIRHWQHGKRGIGNDRCFVNDVDARKIRCAFCRHADGNVMAPFDSIEALNNHVEKCSAASNSSSTPGHRETVYRLSLFYQYIVRNYCFETMCVWPIIDDFLRENYLQIFQKWSNESKTTVVDDCQVFQVGKFCLY